LSKAPSVVVIGGDGIGPEVIESALSVLDAVGFEADVVHAEAGYRCFQRCGQPLPSETLERARNADAVLFGAITTPPEAPDYPSVILELRRELELFANVRPAATFRGVGRYGAEAVDVLIVRENTEGLYVQHGWHEKNRAYNVLRRSRQACERVLHLAFERATQRSGHVAVVHKANVIKPADVFWLELAQQLVRGYDLDCSYEIVDALCTKLVLDPTAFDVIVAPNLYGDILSDLLAGVVGSLGLCASANIGEDHALFEPVHGSAPDIAGRGIANPLAAILSAALLLEHLGQAEKATAVQAAVKQALNVVQTPDLGGTATTQEMTQAVMSGLG